MDFRFRDYITVPFNFLRINREWRKAEQYNADEMEQYIVSRLQNICRYAQQHIPYYRRLFQSINFDPELLTSLEYYRKLPILNKDTIREHFDEMHTDELNKMMAVIDRTSGSTGTPLQFYLDKNVNQAKFCLFYKAWSMAPEWHLGANQVLIGGYSEGVYKYIWKTQILSLSSFYLSENTVELYYDLIKKYRPKFLRGYPSALYLFAKLLEQKGLKLHFSSIFTMSETLLPFQREFIESFFGGKVFDHYSHQEGLASICQCPSGKMHAQNFYGYHEIVDDEGNPVSEGETGRLVCTSTM